MTIVSRAHVSAARISRVCCLQRRMRAGSESEFSKMAMTGVLEDRVMAQLEQAPHAQCGQNPLH